MVVVAVVDEGAFTFGADEKITKDAIAIMAMAIIAALLVRNVLH